MTGDLLTSPRVWFKGSGVPVHKGDIVTRIDVPGVLWEVLGQCDEFISLRRFGQLRGKQNNRRTKKVKIHLSKLRYVDQQAFRAFNAHLDTKLWAPSWGNLNGNRR